MCLYLQKRDFLIGKGKLWLRMLSWSCNALLRIWSKSAAPDGFMCHRLAVQLALPVQWRHMSLLTLTIHTVHIARWTLFTLQTHYSHYTLFIELSILHTLQTGYCTGHYSYVKKLHLARSLNIYSICTLPTVFTFVQAEHFVHKALWGQAVAPKHPKRWLLQFSQRPIYISSNSAKCTMTTLNPLN